MRCSQSPNESKLQGRARRLFPEKTSSTLPIPSPDTLLCPSSSFPYNLLFTFMFLRF